MGRYIRNAVCEQTPGSAGRCNGGSFVDVVAALDVYRVDSRKTRHSPEGGSAGGSEGVSAET
jgi:hypothetical protein